MILIEPLSRGNVARVRMLKRNKWLSEMKSGMKFTKKLK
jgi:hypothetical protein